MTRRRLITWSVAVLAVVAIGVVAARYPAWRCARLLPGLWCVEYTDFAIHDAFSLTVVQTPRICFQRYCGAGTWLRGSCSRQTWEILPSENELAEISRSIERGRWRVEGCDLLVSFTPEGHLESGHASLEYGHLRPTFGEDRLPLHRVTDPPAWLEELLASVPEVEEAER